MAKYQVVYKCPLCNKLLTYGEPQDVSATEQLLKTCNEVIFNQQFAGNPYLYQVPMYYPHICKNGDCGLSQFAGFIKV